MPSGEQINLRTNRSNMFKLLENIADNLDYESLEQEIADLNKNKEE